MSPPGGPKPEPWGEAVRGQGDGDTCGLPSVGGQGDGDTGCCTSKPKLLSKAAFTKL